MGEEQNVRKGTDEIQELTSHNDSPIIKLRGTLPYLNNQVLSGMHLKNWFTSCSPTTECGTWLMNWRLGWTAHADAMDGGEPVDHKTMCCSRTSIVPRQPWDIV